MSNDQLRQFRYSYEAKLVDVYGNISIGATGAPTLNAAKSKGITKIVRNSAGDYTITLKSPFQRVVDCEVRSLVGTIPAAPVVSVKADNSAAATPTVEIVLSAATSSSVTTLAPTDPASGEVLLIHFVLSDSTAY